MIRENERYFGAKSIVKIGWHPAVRFYPNYCDQFPPPIPPIPRPETKSWMNWPSSNTNC